MSTSKPSSSHRQKRLLLALPILLLVALAANWSNVMQVARGEKNLKSIIYGKGGKGTAQVAGWTLPPTMGAETAKVKIEVFLIPGDPCHHETALLGQALGTLDPKRIRVQFTGSPPGSKEADRRDQLKLGCEQGLAVNGKTEFKVPDPARPGKKATLFMTPEGRGLGLDNLYAVLNAELAAAYKGKGLGMTREGFQLHLDNEKKQRLEEALAKQQADQEKTPGKH